MKNRFRFATCFLFGVTAFACHAEPKPLWEVGAGLAVINAPHYRGSEERKSFFLPAPYLIYRGEVVKADRGGVRAALFESDHLELNLSVNGSLPVESEDNPLRRGMPNLRPIVEVGPTADFLLWQSDNAKTRLDFRLPLRAAVTVESSPKHIGWLSSPNLRLRIDDPAGLGGWKLGLQAGPIFGSREYINYFYAVRPGEATANRPLYNAGAGYAGSQMTANLSKRFQKYWVGAFLRYDSLSGAKFAGSPLVQRESAVTGGIALAWIFGASSVMVDSAE